MTGVLMAKKGNKKREPKPKPEPAAIPDGVANKEPPTKTTRLTADDVEYLDMLRAQRREISIAITFSRVFGETLRGLVVKTSDEVTEPLRRLGKPSGE